MTTHGSMIVTIFYYKEYFLKLETHTGIFCVSPRGRVVLPDSFRKSRSIIAIFEGNRAAMKSNESACQK